MRQRVPRIATLLVTLALGTLTSRAFAYNPAIVRGGFGMLFADTNSFQTPGELAPNHGFDVQIAAQRQGTDLAVGPSAAFSTGKFGVGGFYNRVGTDLLTAGSYNETMGGAFGLATLFGRLNLGMGYNRLQTASTSTADLYGSATANFGKDRFTGLMLGLSANQDLGYALATTSASFGIGYAYNRNKGFETNFSLNDFYNPSDWIVGFHGQWSNAKYYAAPGFRYHAYQSFLELMARAGVIKRKWDLSVFAIFPTSVNSPQYGLSLRKIF